MISLMLLCSQATSSKGREANPKTPAMRANLVLFIRSLLKGKRNEINLRSPMGYRQFPPFLKMFPRRQVLSGDLFCLEVEPSDYLCYKHIALSLSTAVIGAQHEFHFALKSRPIQA